MDNEYAFADLIPDELLNTASHSYADCVKLSAELDELRFERQKELAKMLKSSDPEKLKEVINSPLNTLPPEQEEKRKEIKFLANVGMTLLHWHNW